MSPHTRTLRTVALAALIAPVLAMGGAAPAYAATHPGDAADLCTVSGATLDWGFKESFRAYIDSAIANGSWKESGDATYSTPQFHWSQGVGTVDPTTGAMDVSFSGSVEFTGHGGILDTVIENPALHVDPDGTATLALDVHGPTMDGDQIDQTGLAFTTGPSSRSAANGGYTVAVAQPKLTSGGHTAIPNYEAGDTFDAETVTAPIDAACQTALAATLSKPKIDLLAPGVLAGAGITAIAVALLVVAMLRRRSAVRAE